MKKIATLFACVAMTATSAFADAAWMGRIADNVYIDQLSIPGTHDAATGEGTTLDYFARTQALSLAEQFDAGVRAFDLRPAVNGSQLRIYHGIVPTNVTFEDALKILAERLDSNPTEFVVVVMRHEDDSENENSRALWPGLVEDVLTSEALADRLVDFDPELTLGDVRGKILVLSRDRYAPTPVGGYISSWTHSENFAAQQRASISGPASAQRSPLTVQDVYQTEEDMQVKFEVMNRVLDYSMTLNDPAKPHQWVINHASGYIRASVPGASHYRRNATRTNNEFADRLAAATKAGPTGLVMMDFAGVDESGDVEVAGKRLVDAVVDNNFRYEMKTGVSSVKDAVSDATPGVVGGRGCVVTTASAQVFSPDGRLVASGQGTIALRPGLYVVIADGRACRVAVRA